MMSDDDVAALLARLGSRPRRIDSDSRRIAAGDAFAAYPGAHADGRAFIGDAIARGAGSVLWEARGFRWNGAWRVANLGVDDLRGKLGYVADFVYGSPSRALWAIGVTGTNGKTSCSHWIAECLDACGTRAAVIGTLGNGLVGALEQARYTTPDAAVLHETLARLREAGARAVAIEVSSHGLDQGRANGVAFDVALFTNLTRDHLDYHGTMAAYGAAKAKLFAWPGLSASVVNTDDAFGQSLADAAHARGQRVITYGFANADIVPTAMSTAPAGIAMTVATPWGHGELRTRLVGAFNAANMLGVLGVLGASGIALGDALGALADVAPPPGRMQRFGGEGKPLVVVDYAHSPDALEKVLVALRPAVPVGGELAVVFGCGGERDAGKRPLMGRIAATLADRVIVTSDNPRGEDPSAIAQAIVSGVREAGNRKWSIELDRAKAVAHAIAEANWGDVVLVAGKGHEAYQEYAGVRIAYSDAAAATAALEQWSRA